MNRLTSKLNPTDATVECRLNIFKSDSLKVPKLLFRFSLRALNSLATSIRQSLSVLCLWVLSIVIILNLVCVIVERSQTTVTAGGKTTAAEKQLPHLKCRLQRQRNNRKGPIREELHWTNRRNFETTLPATRSFFSEQTIQTARNYQSISGYSKTKTPILQLTGVF